MTFPPLYVLRHGETVWNAEGRWQGRLDSPLTDLGRAQARQQSKILAQLGLQSFDVRVSPQGRALHTAEIVLGRAPVRSEHDTRLREIDVGAWTGLLRKDLVAAPGPVGPHTPDGPLALYEHAPGGEGFTALHARCLDFLKGLTGPTLCITHGITSRMLRAVALGEPAARLGDLPGGQGVVHIVENAVHRTLPEGLAEDETAF